MGHSKEKTGSYPCVCTRCGRRLRGEGLCFDFTPVIQEAMQRFCAGTQETQVVDMVLNPWKNSRRGPTLFSEQELLDWTADLTQTAAGAWKGTLRVPLKDWLDRMEAWNGALGKLPQEQQSAWGAVLVRMSEHYGGAFLQIPVDYYKAGKGAIRVSEVRTEGGAAMDVRYCPFCGEEMSFWSGRFPELVLTVIGGPRISKSTALAACASFFQKRGGGCGVTWEGSDVDQNWRDFQTRCLDRYSANKRVEPTRIGDRDAIPRFSVLVTVKGVEGTPERKLILTVVDLPGEYDANTEKGGVRLGDQVYEEYQELYRSVDCVWYCTDQAELEQLKIEDDSEGMERKRAMLGYEQGRRLISTSQRVDKLKRYAELFQKDTPVVFLLGKSDCYRNEVDNQDLYQAHYDPHHCDWLILPASSSPVFLGRAYHRKAALLRKFLMSRNAELVKGFEEAFSARTYIAASSYGHPVERDAPEQAEIAPYQTELPFLWMLAVKGYLMIKEQSEETYADRDRLTWENLCLYGGRTETYGRAGQKKNASRWGLFGRK